VGPTGESVVGVSTGESVGGVPTGASVGSFVGESVEGDRVGVPGVMGACVGPGVSGTTGDAVGSSVGASVGDMAGASDGAIGQTDTGGSPKSLCVKVTRNSKKMSNRACQRANLANHFFHTRLTKMVHPAVWPSVKIGKIPQSLS